MRVNNQITIDLNTGTKIRETEYDAVYPESIDVKVTNKCASQCLHCHESSGPNGRSFKVKDALRLLKQLPYPTEIAVGGGDPSVCAYEINQMARLLTNCIINVTLNVKHVSAVKDIQANAFGISIPRGFRHSASFFTGIPNYVIHLIVGVNTVEDLKYYIMEHPRVLVLGYKNFGRGAEYNMDWDIKLWRFKIGDVLNLDSGVLAFDNLALEQLDVKRFFNKKHYEELFLGEDGKYSMYLDLVKMQYAKSSIGERFDIGDKDIKTMFKHIKSDLCEVVNWCECCGTRPIQGKCIINGMRKDLSRTCRYCYMRNPEDSVQGGKRARSGNFFIHDTAETTG